MGNVNKGYIKLLTAVAEAEQFPIMYQEDTDPKLLRLLAEMINSDLLDGRVATGDNGAPDCIAVLAITTAGREYLSKLEKEQFESSPVGKVISFGKFVLSNIITAIISASAGAFVTWLIMK